jgi:hypothetical protein
MIPNLDKEREFDAVKFFRNIKERIAKATEGMTLQERRELFQKIREGKIKLA